MSDVRTTQPPPTGLQKKTSAKVPAVAAPAPKPVIIKADSKPKRGWDRLHAPPRMRPIPMPRRAMLTVVVATIVVTALLAAQPLHVSADPSSGGLTAFAGLTPWSPPPPTIPPLSQQPPGFQPPHSSDPGRQAVINEIVAVFGQYAPGALNVARCESDYDPNARNVIAIGNSHAMGVFQILYPSTWDGTSYHAYSPYDANANIHAAYEIFKRDGYSWREWQCKPY